MVIKRFIRNIDLVLFATLIAFGWYVLASRPWGILHDQAAAASLSGALFGGAALLLGNWINRANVRLRAAQQQTGQIEKLKTVIAAELVNVACGLISAKQIVDAAVISARDGDQVPHALDMSLYKNRGLSPVFNNNCRDGSPNLLLGWRGVGGGALRVL